MTTHNVQIINEIRPKLKPLGVNETMVFTSPVEGEDDILLRTGTIGEGSCFFHSMLHATDQDYRKMECDARKKYVKDLRSRLASNLTISDWEKLGCQNLARLQFQTQFHQVLNQIYLFLKKDSKPQDKTTRLIIRKIIETKEDLKSWKILIDTLPLKKLEKYILPSAYQSVETCQDASVYKIKLLKQIINEYTKEISIYKGKVERNQLKKMVSKMLKLFSLMVKFSYQTAFEDYKTKLQDVQEPIDSQYLELLSDHFKRDVYFLDGGATRLPYQMGNSDFLIKNRKSIVMVWLNRNHYEIAGLFNDNTIKRNFNPDHNFIKNIKKHLK